MKNLPVVGLHIDKRRKTTKGFPVKLRVTYNRIPRYYSTGFHLSEEDFIRVTSKNEPRSKELKETKEKLLIFEKTAKKVINDLGDLFTFDEFKERFFSNHKRSTDLIGLFDEYITEELQKKGRAGTASSYNNAKNSFQEYIGKNKKIDFKSITPRWLENYQEYMTSAGKSLTTVGIYCRSLRTIFNLAIEKDIIAADRYPFGKRKFQIPSGQNIKKALNKNELKAIFEYKPESGTGEELARDLWMFSYLCNGANIKDICRLKNKNLEPKTIHFIRAKTERSTIKNQKNITASRNQIIDDILKRHASISLNPESHLFPFLDGSESPERQLAITRQVIKNTNKWMDRIAKKLNIEKKVTTYTARHSYATMLKRGGASTEFISESLGHGNLHTTENYLDSFEDEKEKNILSYL